jgi:hypothetical protein
MAHPFKHVGSLVIVLLVTYFVIRNWTGIKSAVTGASVPGAKPGGSLLSFFGLPAGNATNGAPGDPAFISAFGGGGSGFSGGDSVIGPNGRVGDENSLAGGPSGFPGGFTGFGGSGGGAIDYSYTAAGNNTGPVPSSFGGNCSTHLTDGKPICA